MATFFYLVLPSSIHKKFFNKQTAKLVHSGNKKPTFRSSSKSKNVFTARENTCVGKEAVQPNISRKPISTTERP